MFFLPFFFFSLGVLRFGFVPMRLVDMVFYMILYRQFIKVTFRRMVKPVNMYLNVGVVRVIRTGKINVSWPELSMYTSEVYMQHLFCELEPSI